MYEDEDIHAFGFLFGFVAVGKQQEKQEELWHVFVAKVLIVKFEFELIIRLSRYLNC